MKHRNEQSALSESRAANIVRLEGNAWADILPDIGTLLPIAILQA